MKRTAFAGLALFCAAACAQVPGFSAEELANRQVQRRAIEAVNWGMPLVNTDAMRQAYFRLGAKYNDICFFSKPADWRFQVLTPNASTHYVYFNFNLKDGPVVLDIPAPVGAGLLGAVIDAWDVTTAGVGPEDENKGQAAKYLLLPPKFSGDVPPGYIAVHLPTFNGYSLMRVIPAGSSDADVAAVLALVKQLRVYPLAQAGKPPEQRFIDIHGKTFDAVPAFDESFFVSLDRMVQEEPVRERDLVAMGMLKSVGIEKGREFKPDAATQRIFKAAAQEQHAVFVQGMKSSRRPWWPDRRWVLPDTRGVKSNFSYVTDTAIELDARGLTNFAAFGLPKRVGQGGSIVYLIGFRDAPGEVLSGERSYRLHVPPNVPARQYWSAVVYDSLTNSFFRESPVVSLDSYSKTMRRNADGSVDLYFGPSAPAGQESNWIYTAPGRNWFMGFRMYDPDKPFFNKAWTLADIERLQ